MKMTQRSKPNDQDWAELYDEMMADSEGSGDCASTLDPNVINALRRGRHIKARPTLDEIDHTYD
jgi:hypothetical protein